MLTELETITRRLSNWRVNPSDGKAFRYVGQFFDRKRRGLKIMAHVVGNHGTYTVSVDASADFLNGACSCYIGAGGGCHHVRALAQTFLDAPDSFISQESRSRDQVRTLDDLALYLEATPLETLLDDLKSRGLAAKQVGELLSAGKRTLGDAARGEARNQLSEALGALKLACLYLLEWLEAAASGNQVATALTGSSRRQLLDLIGELVARLDPVE
jgi:uncharacterized Zn finger protein